MPEITRDGYVDDLLSRVLEEAGNLGPNAKDPEVEVGEHIRLVRPTIPHHLHSAEDHETPILVVLCRGKQVEQSRPCELSFLPA